MSVFGQTSGNKLVSLKIFHCVNVEPSLENPIPTMNLVYDRYESSVKKKSFFGVEKPYNTVSRIKE